MMTPPKRGPGRPRIHEGEDDRVYVRLPKGMRQQVRIAAAKADISMGGWVAQAIQHELEREPASGVAL